MSLQPFLSGSQSVLEFIAALIVLIVLHELGHFLACRLFNVEVEEFGIGIPPRAATLFESRGTKFTLNWLPLGGFVRPKGENDPSVTGGLAAANPWVRLVVFFAGPVMNILTGMILLSVMYFVQGTPEPSKEQVVISGVSADTPAQAAGLQTCDIVVSVNREPISSVAQLQSVIRAKLGQEVLFAYQRDGQAQQASITPRLNPPAGQGALGITLMSYPLEYRPVQAGEAIQMGAAATQQYASALFGLPVRLLQGQLKPGEADVMGLPGMIDVYSEIRTGDATACLPAKFNVVSVLTFFAAISLSLGIINLLPIPALDGGRIVFLLPEIVLRRRIPPERENAVNAISFIILILLLLFVNLRDLVNIFTRPK